MANATECETGATWQNWAGNQTAQPAFLCTPQSKDDLIAIVQQAASAGTTIRAVGASYSWSPVVPCDGYLINMSQLNNLLSVDTTHQQITVEAGMVILSLSAAAAENNLAFETSTVIPWIEVGGAVANGCHGTGYNANTLSDLVVAMEVVLADGSCRTFSVEQDGEDMMNVLRVSLGALGIIYSVTFQCVPMFNLHAVDSRADMVATIAGIKDLVTSHDYVEVFWFPFNTQCWIKTWDKTDDPITEGPVQRIWDILVQFLQTEYLGGTLMDVLTQNPNLTPGMTQLFSHMMPETNVVAQPMDVFHYQTSYVKVWDMGYHIPIDPDFANVQNAWNAVVNRINTLAQQGQYPQNMVLHTRYIKGSSAYMSPAVGNTQTCCIETLTFCGDNRPVDVYQPYFQAVEQDWLALGGKPHWGKAIYTVDNLKAAYGANMDAFLKVRQELDPNQIFVNDFVRQVFQLGAPSK